MQASLYCNKGTSDKEYHIEIVAVEGGHAVNYRNGRRGEALRPGTRTQTPVTREEAEAIFQKVVKQKLADGYKPGETGASYQDLGIAAKTESGLYPQLLNSISEERAIELIEDDAWMMEEKMDGKRNMTGTVDGKVTASNKKGQIVAIPRSVEADLQRLGNAEVDGELIGETYHLFDCLSFNGSDYRIYRADHRYAIILKELAVAGDFEHLSLVDAAFTTEEKRALFERVRATNGEGVVFKLMSAPYEPGRPNSGGTQLKFKFKGQASCIVTSNHPSKRSVGLVLLDDCGAGVEVGNVTIPPNKAVPEVGAVVEVEYLYAYKGGSLFQPVYLHERDDVDQDECLMAQLKYKPDDEG